MGRVTDIDIGGLAVSRELSLDVARSVEDVMREPILKLLLARSNLTEAQLETLLIDLVIEDMGVSVSSYEMKARYRSRKSAAKRGVSRGAFNRTLAQARRNVMRSIYTMILLSYLGLLDHRVFRPFEEIASRIEDYRRIRDVLARKKRLTAEDMESYRTAERIIETALKELTDHLALRPRVQRKGTTEGEDEGRNISA